MFDDMMELFIFQDVMNDETDFDYDHDTESDDDSNDDDDWK